MVRNHKKPQYNILFLLEGEEEIGSPHLKEYLLQDRAANQADYYLLVDGTSPYTDRPALYTGSLGAVFGELVADSKHGDLHSGIFGEEATQPVAALAAAIQDLYSNKPALDFSAVEDWSFSVNYLSAGSDPAKLIIPGRASAMISYRFSAGIEPATITAGLQDYCAKLSIKHKMDIGFSPRVIIKAAESQPGWLFNQCSESLKEIGLTHFTGRLQGSLPVASVINEIYGADSVILSSGSKGNHTHGVNERMAISSIRRSISFFEHMLK
jgi:acetylornithine deacetylase/succinyl-diaminopimelate desuccinylase-like protein